MSQKQFYVQSGQEQIWVTEQGNPNNPTVLLIHGFPDDHRVWSKVAQALLPHYHVLALDLRGSGRSSCPERKSGFRIDQVIPDFWAVINACVGDKKVHLVAHDWGSALAWSFVTEPRYAACLHSYTSISGPHVALLWHWINQQIRSGSPSRARNALGQLSHSWYIFAMHIPGFPETLFSRLGKWVWPAAMKQGGVESNDPYLQHSPEEIKNISLNTIELYRQNAFRPPTMPEPGGIQLPAQLIELQNEPFIRPYVFEGLENYVPQLTRRSLDANHWAPRTHPKQVAALIHQYITQLQPSPEPAL